MRWLAVLATLAPAVGAAGCSEEAAPAGGVALVLDIPNGMLDPTGYTTVEVTFHTATGDLVRTAAVSAGDRFDLGDFEPTAGVSIEATLRDAAGAAVGYGRTAAPTDLAADAEIIVPVRRPIIYFAGLVSDDADGDPSTPDVTWTTAPATFSDLSATAPLDGSTQLGTQAVLMVSAGPNLYLVEQATSNPTGQLVGMASVRPVSTADHAVAVPLAAQPTGSVLDGAGSDDGATLVIGTSSGLFAFDTATGASRETAAGHFARVAVIAGADGVVGALAIRNRPVTTNATCASAELVWITFGDEIVDARTIATGPFTDVAADQGKGYAVDCGGALVEATADGVLQRRTGLGRATALAVSNGAAYVGVESPARAGAPATLSLVVTPLTGSTPLRTLWTDVARQVLDAPTYPGVQRLLDADRAAFGQLEVGAGGDYVAATMISHFFGNRVSPANFPEMDIDTEELRVFDPASGGVIQRYRSWCSGSYSVLSINDIDEWACATTTGQTAPERFALEHRISSMTFVFGKK